MAARTQMPPDVGSAAVPLTVPMYRLIQEEFPAISAPDRFKLAVRPRIF